MNKFSKKHLFDFVWTKGPPRLSEISTRQGFRYPGQLNCAIVNDLSI